MKALLPHAAKCISSVFGAVFDFWFLYEISRESLNGFVPNSHRCVWSLVWTSLNVKVKGQGHQGQTTFYSWIFSQVGEDLTFLKDDMQRFFTKLMQKSFLAAYCNINPSV